jgi:1,4-dihydroxy-2-naphthoyl-CoA hydrolase
MIWAQEFSLEDLNGRSTGHIGEVLEIEFTEILPDSISARMPVNEKTRQPYGILHGGASVVLAETLGSVASNLVINSDKYIGVGLEVNANHLRPVKSGYVTGVCSPIHIGGKTHVWDIKLYDERGKMTCVSRLTVAIIPKT